MLKSESLFCIKLIYSPSLSGNVSQTTSSKSAWRFTKMQIPRPSSEQMNLFLVVVSFNQHSQVVLT